MKNETSSWLDHSEEKDSLEKMLQYFSVISGLKVELVDENGETMVSTKNHVPDCRFCQLIKSTAKGQKKCCRSYARAGREAAKYGEPYVFRCHAGLISWAVPLIIQDHHCAITCGQALMWEVEDYFLDEITMMVNGLDVDLLEVKLSALELNYLPSAKVQAITELLFVIANQIMSKGTSIFTEQQNIQAYQAALSENFASRKNIATLFSSEIGSGQKSNMRNMEKELIAKIRGGDADAAGKDIDDLLGEIMQTGAKSVLDVKGRILELLVSLSHAAVDGGMNEDAMASLNSRFYDELYNKKTAEEIYYWTKNVVNIYSEEVRKAQNKDNFQSVYAAAEYIRNHFREKITVHQIAEKVHLSDSYLSHIFSETFGRTITEYITSVRIEYAKRMLAKPGSSISEIALECGFEDVSYFSRVFKKSEGITPRDYKKKAISAE